MLINVEGAIKEMYFKDIPQGEFFAPYPNSLYLKIEEIINTRGLKLNAIDMEGGHSAHFENEQEVYPIDSEVTATYSHYDYEIENN